jgi:hypothetical protein
MVIAACGSNSPSSPSAATGGGRMTYAQAQQDAVRFAHCMRSHGVPSFPDPTSPRVFKESFNSSAASSPGFRSAAAGCQHLLPGGGGSNRSAPRSRAEIAAALALARCMRDHGFPGFPDPTSDGQLTHQMLATARINLHQPAFVQAADACVGVTHGLLTRASVARFIAGQ